MDVADISPAAAVTSSTTSFQPLRAWWKSATVYQIYPSSFLDTNGDGVGDLRGITARLDYLKHDVGVDVLWLCPVHMSPWADGGYDIADYRRIDPRYGSLEDWDNLLAGVHKRGMKLLMDLVANHTSDQHAWFEESRSSKSNPKRNWYIWRPPRYDEQGNRMPPNNWKSIFQGSAWEYDPATEEYYLHLFVKEQPDLNWENPAVREAVYDTMRFWMDRGCDGFRMDVINMISKVEGLPNAVVTSPKEPYQPAGLLYVNGPNVHTYIKEMHERVISQYDMMTVGETPLTHRQVDIAAWVLPANKELHMVFQFELMDIDSGGVEGGAEAVSPLIYRPWKLREMKHIVEKWQTYMREEGYWNAIYIENHDHARSVSRFGDDSDDLWRTKSAQILAILKTTQSGTLFVYQGQELGLRNFPRSWGIEEYKDVASLNFWNQELAARLQKLPPGSSESEVDMSDVLDAFQQKARDHARTPMQWDATPHAGFTTGTPWMRVNDDFKTWNAAAQRNDTESVLNFWKNALRVRREHEVLIYGAFRLLTANNEQLFAYTKTLGNVTALILMNFGKAEVETTEVISELQLLYGEASATAQLPEKARLVLANYTDATLEGKTLPKTLKGWEGRVYVWEDGQDEPV